MTVRVEVITPCPHGEYRMHQIQGEGNLVLRVCDDISRRSFTEWPPEAIEAALKVYETEFPCVCTPEYIDRNLIAPNCEHHAGADVVPRILAAALGHITGDNK